MGQRAGRKIEGTLKARIALEALREQATMSAHQSARSSAAMRKENWKRCRTVSDALPGAARHVALPSGDQLASVYAGGRAALRATSMSCSGKASLDTPIRLLAH
jgi:hypothetical protein